MTFTDMVPPEILTAIVADAVGQGAALSEPSAPDAVEVVSVEVVSVEVVSVEVVSVEVVSAEAVRWNDGSLGCPEPGRSYTQSLVDGYRVIVRAGDVELDYRVNGRGRFRICRQAGGPSARSFR